MDNHTQNDLWEEEKDEALGGNAAPEPEEEDSDGEEDDEGTS